MAETKIALMPEDFRSDRVRYNSSSDCPDQNTCSNWSSWRRNLPKEIHLSATMAQVHIDAPISPSMTSLTTKPACMKSDQSVTSLVAASPTCSIQLTLESKRPASLPGGQDVTFTGRPEVSDCRLTTFKVFSRSNLVKGWRMRSAQS
jgi:hypothetical protein